MSKVATGKIADARFGERAREAREDADLLEVQASATLRTRKPRSVLIAGGGASVAGMFASPQMMESSSPVRAMTQKAGVASPGRERRRRGEPRDGVPAREQLELELATGGHRESPIAGAGAVCCEPMAALRGRFPRHVECRHWSILWAWNTTRPRVDPEELSALGGPGPWS